MPGSAGLRSGGGNGASPRPVHGLLRDATPKPGKACLDAATVHQVVTLTCAEPPGEATQWTGRAIARHTGVSLRSVQGIWAAHDLQPYRIRTFKRSSDPAFAEKLEDIVGLYLEGCGVDPDPVQDHGELASGRHLRALATDPLSEPDGPGLQ